jgi:hypothetical protein
MRKKLLIKNQRGGQLSLEVLFFAAIVVLFITGFIFLSLTFLKLSVRGFNKTMAFSISEAGIEYYRWHLAHAPQDYQDGTGVAGPYIHDYYDKSGVKIGQFKLEITPPPPGSTIVKIKSTGEVVADSSIEKVIQVTMGIPSFAKYAIAANDNMRFGEGTEVFGEVMSNGGIRFDGIAHNLVRSGQATYVDPDHTGGNEFGVHTHLAPTDPLPPAAVPNRTDVFTVGRQFPVPALDFAGMTQDLATIRAGASSSGVYATSSGALGFDLVFSSTSQRYSLYRVTALTAAPSGCTNSQNQTGWGTWSIQTETLIASGTVPANGLFFFEDNLWVRGKINGSRITVGSGRFPDNVATRTNITVNNDLLYTNYTGLDVIALIAQNNINVGLVSENDLRIDAALIAQNGRVGRYYYRPPGGGSQRCSPNHVRQALTAYGMVGTNQRYGFAYTDDTGYQDRNLIYDSNLLYGPPPSFPLTSDQYTLISWEEVK